MVSAFSRTDVQEAVDEREEDLFSQQRGRI